MHPYTHLGGLTLPSYGLMGLLGAAAAALYLFLTNRGGKAGRLPGDDLLHIGLLAGVGALVGAKLLHLITMLPVLVRTRELWMAQPSLLLPLLQSGFVFYGGLLGGLFAVWLYCRRYAVPLAIVAGLVTPAVPLFHAFGRVGCFLAGCCWGVPWHGGVVFHESAGAPNGVALFPVQLVEAVCNLALFLLLAVLSRRLVEKWRVLPLYLGLYACLRFVLEFFRGDAARGGWLLSTSQWVSLVILASLGVWAVWWSRAKRQPAGNSPP